MKGCEGLALPERTSDGRLAFALQASVGMFALDGNSPAAERVRCSRKAAAIVRNAPFDRASDKLACNTISDEGKGGNWNFAPTSMRSRGATRCASGAIAKPAETAAVTAAIPPPTKTSIQSRPAASSARVATLLTPQDVASEASLMGPPILCSKLGAANQLKRSNVSTSPLRRSSSLRTITASSVPRSKDSSKFGDPSIRTSIKRAASYALRRASSVGSSGPIWPLLSICRAG